MVYFGFLSVCIGVHQWLKMKGAANGYFILPFFPRWRSLPAFVMSAAAVSVANLEIRIGHKLLLSDISFDVPAGSFIAIIGASGCGKSTLIKTLAGQLVPSKGKVSIAGHAVRQLKKEFPLAVGYLPQFGAFHPELSVLENLQNAVALRLPNSVPPAVQRNWMRHIIEVARLEPFLQQTYRTLSGGQMRRMALAEELIGDPAIFLLDELTSGLDAFSDREMMIWLRELARQYGKTIVLVTHATYHLEYCDAILFLHKGRMVQFGTYQELLDAHGVASIADLFAIYQTQDIEFPPAAPVAEVDYPPQPLKTASPPGGGRQFCTLLARQAKLFWRDKVQVGLHLSLALTFPAVVAVFATKGLPQVRSLTLSLETNIIRTLVEQLQYLQESYHAASLISGLTMFQVILLTLIGANNGAREIAKEREVLQKELRAGLSPLAYVLTKFLQVAFLSLLQAFWMAWFVKTVCGFPGEFILQFGILFTVTLAMSATCLAISAACASPERASLLAIYLVGFQLPLSGAALALPEWLSLACRPFIAAYWGWSGYLKTFESFRHYDIVKQSTATFIAPYHLCLLVLGLHILAALAAGWWFTRKMRFV
jgi:ABC-type multidrug transport system ATPase subunit